MTDSSQGPAAPEQVHTRRVFVPPSPVYLSALAHRLGKPVALSELDDEAIHAELRNLHDAGMEFCRVAPGDRIALASASARQSLGSGCPPLDGIVYSTDTIGSSPTLEVQELLGALGRTADRVLVIGGSACGNLGPALETSTAWLATGCVTTLLLVTADEAVDGSRYLDSGQAALSDGAASCCVSTVPLGPGFRVLAQLSMDAPSGETPTSRSLGLRHTAARVKQVTAAVTRAAGLDISDYRHVLTGNLGSLMRAFLAMAARTKIDCVYAPKVATTGHCFAADILIGLHTLVAERSLKPADRLLLLPTSPRTCSAIAVEYVE